MRAELTGYGSILVWDDDKLVLALHPQNATLPYVDAQIATINMILDFQEQQFAAYQLVRNELRKAI